MIQKNKIISLVSDIKSTKANDDGSVTIEGMANVATTDRVGDIVVAEAWKKGGLVNFKKNPIILFNHNYSRPIGKAVDIEPSDNGLKLKAKISKAASDVVDLIKDGVLGTFSVGFMIKEADYIEETGGLKITDAELLEVSVVSVPAHQDATFSVAKSFDSIEEYRDYVKTLGVEKPTEEESSKGKDTPSADTKSEQEMNMTEEELQKLLADAASKAAQDTANRIKAEKAAEQAKEKAAKEKADREAKEREDLKKSVKIEVTEGVETLMKDLEDRVKELDNVQEAYNELKKDLDEKAEEITKMRESKRLFDDRESRRTGSPTEQTLRSLAEAKLYGVVKGLDYADNPMFQDIAEKAGLDTTNVGKLDDSIVATIEKEIQLETKVAPLFREIPVQTGNTAMTIQLDTDPASWVTAAASGNLQNRGGGSSKYQPTQVTMVAERLVSSTYLDDDTDEQFLPNFMPLLLDSVVRAHARAVDAAFIAGNSSGIVGLDAAAPAAGQTLSISGSAILDGSDLMGARQQMGRYGVSPRDIVYVVNVTEYLNLMDDTDFHDMQEIGSDAVKLTGQIGRIWGSPVIVSDEFAAKADGIPAALAIYTRNFVVPRLKGISLETDREVANQRNFIVAAQSLGLTELVAGATGAEPVTKVDYVT